MLILLLSGFFCCLCVSGVNCFLLFGRVRALFSAVWAGARAPPKQQKNTSPPKQHKNERAFAPSKRVLFCCLGRWAFLIFLLFLRGACFFVLLFGRVAVFFFFWEGGGCLGGVVNLFAAWAGGIFFLLFVRVSSFLLYCLGAGRVFFCCLGGAREFTHLPVCLAPLHSTQQQKKTKQHEKKRVPGIGQGIMQKRVQAHQHGAVDSLEGVWGHGFSRRSFLHEKFGSFSLFAAGSCNAGSPACRSCRWAHGWVATCRTRILSISCRHFFPAPFCSCPVCPLVSLRHHAPHPAAIPAVLDGFIGSRPRLGGPPMAFPCRRRGQCAWPGVPVACWRALVRRRKSKRHPPFV